MKKWWQTYKGYSKLFLALWLFMLLAYYFTSVGVPEHLIGLQMRRFVPCALGMTAAVALWRQHGLRTGGLLPHALVALAWVLTYNICDFVTLRHAVPTLSNHRDIAFGAYLFTGGVCLRLLLLRFTAWNQRWVRWLFAIAHTLLLSIPVAEMLYYHANGRGLSASAFVAAMQASMLDIRAVYLQHLRFGGLLLALAVLVLVLSFFYRLHKVRLTLAATVAATSLPAGDFDPPRPSARALALMLALVCVTGAYNASIFHGTGVVESYDVARQYFKVEDSFKQAHARNLAHLHVTPTEPLFKQPGTVVLVLGDSASRTFMQAYGYSEFPNTPWLSDQVNRGDMLLFRHAYSSNQRGLGIMAYALTASNLYGQSPIRPETFGLHGETEVAALSLLDLAKKAGYRTWWLSNQWRYSRDNAAVTQIAKTADYSFWLEETLNRRNRATLDGDLLPLLQQVDPTRDNLVVVHLRGNHEIYMNRYPKNFARFSEPGQFTLVRNYADSVAYTDWVLQQIFEYGRAHWNLQSLVYTSDKGENPYAKRMQQESPFIRTRIPLCVWLSDEYKALYPARAATLALHRDKYWTNDLLYDLVGGLLGLQSDALDLAGDLGSPQYRHTRKTLQINLDGKQHSLAEDENENVKEY